jgi:5'-3' exonuclease
MTQPVYLIDASIFVFRAWHAVPNTLVDPDGNPVNAFHGFARFMGEPLNASENSDCDMASSSRAS